MELRGWTLIDAGVGLVVLAAVIIKLAVTDSWDSYFMNLIYAAPGFVYLVLSEPIHDFLEDYGLRRGLVHMVNPWLIRTLSGTLFFYNANTIYD